ncbi:MAG: DUF2007 domain-containing protein [Bacteroidales bacterium]|jgi:hypothetical protein|nr:DUF2007 domain-containing protein [Bacteroidales bacterium]
MNEKDLIKIFTGTEIAVIQVKEILDENGIPTLMKNGYQSGISAGFIGGTPSTIELYVLEEDKERAEAIVKEISYS